MALLGDDGRGYDLARRLETSGVWRTWLGDSLYSTFHHYLSSPSSWDAFMRVDDSKSRAQIQLQLRVRALLFDKAIVSLFLRSQTTNTSSATSTSSGAASSIAVSKLNPNYLQLHGDDVYYTLENGSPDGGFQRDGGLPSNPALYKNQSKPGFRSGSRGSESEFGNLSQRSRNDELPETWYSQFIAKYGFKYGVSVGDRESDKRTPEGMSTYLKVVDKHKRKRVPIQEDQGLGNSAHMSRTNAHPNSLFDGSSPEDDILFLPETMFRMNCVPETALPPISRAEDNLKMEFYGVLDTLPQVTTRSPVMIERLGILPEYLSMEQRGGFRRVRSDKVGLSEDQALQMSRKVVARVLMAKGFEGATEVPVDVFSQLLSRHVCKLGRILKLLTDSYRKQCSAVELLKMFLHTTGYSNFGSLSELVKDGTRNYAPNQQQSHVLQPQLHPQQQTQLRLPQQIPRQMHPQMQQMVHPQNLTFQQQQQQQQQLERMRRRQATSPRPTMDMEKDRPLVQVKVEHPTEMPPDGHAFNPMNPRHQQQMQQLRQQQQMAAMSNLHQQSGNNQFRQLASMQIPQMQAPNTGMVRAQPVKVEGFQELMGGDTSLKHDVDDKLRSPTGK